MRTHALQTTATVSGAPIIRFGAANSSSPGMGVPDGQLSVLVCDDRADVRQELSRVFQLRSQRPVASVGDGGDLLDAYQTRSPAQVMIGVHPGSNFGSDALDLLLAHHPTALPVLYGSRRDIELLARVYTRGAAGLVLWEIGNH